MKNVRCSKSNSNPHFGFRAYIAGTSADFVRNGGEMKSHTTCCVGDPLVIYSVCTVDTVAGRSAVDYESYDGVESHTTQQSKSKQSGAEREVAIWLLSLEVWSYFEKHKFT